MRNLPRSTSATTILHGRLEYARDQDYAVRVTIVQEGSENESSGSWTVTWRESGRSVAVAPFYIVHASGARVRVEPGPRTMLRGDLTSYTPVDRSRRHRIATLLPGQDVWVTGQLGKDTDPEAAGSYRASVSWVMRPTTEAMSVSTETPEKTLLASAAHARLFARLFAIELAMMVASHVHYQALLFFGEPAHATYYGKHMSDDDYEVDVRVTNGKTTFEDEWDLERDVDLRAPAMPVIASFAPIQTSLPGNAPRALGGISVMLLALFGITFLIMRGTRAPKYWYDGKSVVDSYGGRLEVIP